MGDIKKKMTQLELKLEPTISEMKNIPDGIKPHQTLEKITELLGIIEMIKNTSLGEGRRMGDWGGKEDK